MNSWSRPPLWTPGGSLNLERTVRVGVQSGLGPCPGWGPVRVGALSGLGPCPGWGPVRVGALSGLGPFPGWGPHGPIGPFEGPSPCLKLQSGEAFLEIDKNHTGVITIAELKDFAGL